MLNHNKVLEHLDELNEIDEYIPLVLHRYVGLSYFDRATGNAIKEYYRVRTGLQGASDYNKYLEDDLKKWLKNHKEFEDIING